MKKEEGVKSPSSPTKKKASSPSKAKQIIPSNLPKSPSLEHLVTKFLALQFGEERVINVSPLTEMAMKKDDEEQMLVWNLKIDNDEAVITVQSDGISWVGVS